MYIPEPTAGGDWEITPAGNHAAICYRFIDLGTHLEDYMGTKNLKRKVLMTWELPTELMTTGEYAGKPFQVGSRYTWSMSEKATLRKHLEAWRGRAFTDDDFAGPKRFNIKNVLGKACLINVVHKTNGEKTYANIGGIGPMPKGMPIPNGVNPLVYFSLERPLFDNAVLEGLSDRLKETIKGTPEYAEIIAGTPPRSAKVGDVGDDFADQDIPF
jgi:hypothetical protein